MAEGRQPGTVADRRRARRQRWSGLRRRRRAAVRRASWPVVIGLAVTAVVLGYRGYGQVHGFHSGFDRLYAAVALFRFETAGSPPFPTSIGVARWLAMFVTSYAFLRAAGALFGEHVDRLRVRWLAREHVVVCGVGRYGSRLARSFHDDGYDVVLVDRSPAEADLAYAKEEGIPVLRADAHDAETLRAARVDRAAYLLIACGDDGINADVALLASAVGNPHRVLQCFVHIADEAMCRLLREAELDREGAVVVSYFNIQDEAPRALFRAFRFDEGREPPVVLVAGTGGMRTNLVVEACRRWVLTPGGRDRRLQVGLVSPDAVEFRRSVLERHRGVEAVCDLVAQPGDPSDADADLLAIDLSDAPAVVLALVYENDDTVTLRSSIRVRRALGTRGRVIACTSAQSGVARLLERTNGRMVDASGVAGAAGTNGLALPGTDDLGAGSAGGHGGPGAKPRGAGSEGGTEDLVAGSGRPASLRRDALAVESARRTDGLSAGPAAGIEVFPLLDLVCTSGIVLNGEVEYVAQAIHGEYLARAKERPDSAADRAVLVPWERLPMTYRQANRAQARDMRRKLASAGYEIAMAPWDAEPLVTFTPETMSVLARMEHERWMTDRAHDGWRYGPLRDNRRKLHPSMVPWEELSDSERQKDVDAVENIPRILARAGLSVIRRQQSQTEPAPSATRGAVATARAIETGG
jgi:hypothetical protein